MNLPPNWEPMSLDALYATLNDPRRFPAPQSTIDAIMYSVRVRGVAALHEPANLERLARCDEDARRQINERIEKLFFSEASAG